MTPAQASVLISQNDRAEKILKGLRVSSDAMGQGLVLTVDTLGTHTEMLRQLLAAAAQTPPDSELPDLLEALTAEIAAQNARLDGLQHAITQLPAQIAVSVEQGVRAALVGA